jgi:pimeloyl-ACP methyl ester carboxylesterase
VTILFIRPLLSAHVFIGMLLIPPVVLKLASTGWRFVRYYSGDRLFRAKGPPLLPLRMLAPLVVASTLSVFATGVALLVLGPGGGVLLGLHKASFVVWLAATGIHVLAHVRRLPGLLAADWRAGAEGAGAFARRASIAGALVAGAILRFDERKIYLFGESGGSIIGVLAVQEHPELYHAWIGSGQMVDPRETDRLIYRDLLAYAAKHDDTSLTSKLRGYGPPPYGSVYAYGYVLSQYDKLAGDYREPKAYKHALVKAGVGPFGVLGSEYTLPEKMNVLRGLIDTFSVMYPRWQTIDFRRSVEELKVPVYIFTGKHELAARRDLALAWFQRLRAPAKRLYDYPDAGHATAFEHFQDVHRIMVETVVPATYSN